MDKKPLITIVTVCFNSEKTIEDTLRSIDRQTFAGYEHVIIDGLSKDRTLSIVEKYGSLRRRVFSGTDKGLYDAMNKGISLAKGEYVFFLNSDDFFSDESVLADVADRLVSVSPDVLFGNIVYVDREKPQRITRNWRSKNFSRLKMAMGWHPPHSAFFARAEVLKLAGGFKLKYPIAADYDLMTGVLRKSKTVLYLDRLVTNMREGGLSNASIKNILRANWECAQASRGQGNWLWLLVPVFKPLSKIIQLSR